MIKQDKQSPFEYGNAICYSGYRDGHSPVTGIFPSAEQIRQDLEILADNWQYLRLYDPGPHAQTVLETIRKEGFDFKVMLGIDLGAEVNNPGCPWGADYDDETLADNRHRNHHSIDRAIVLANEFSESVFSVSIGNEASVEWTDHLVPTENLIHYARWVKSEVKVPVTFCENYVPWQGKLQWLAEELDFISLHTYPVWEYRGIEEALDYTRENYQAVKAAYPDKPVIITEAGWTTMSNGRGIEPWNANESLQETYVRQLMDWAREEQILTFVFEAFDEPWKGSGHPQEPEKHWGLYYVDRTPKRIAQSLFTP